MDFKEITKDDSQNEEVSSCPIENHFRKSIRNNPHQSNVDQHYFLNFLNTVKKSNRNSMEMNIIVSFLKSLTDFYNIIKTAHENHEELLSRIAISMKHQFFEANTLMFRTGDKGEKFYVILKGKINILIARDIKLMMSEEEYMLYLGKLRINNEIELFNRCLSINKNAYPIHSDGFEDSYMVTLFKNKKGILKKPNLMKQLNEVAEKLNDSDPSNIVKNNYTIKYLRDLEPLIMSNNMCEKKEVIIWKYYNVLSLSVGQHFGEVALQNYSNKRTATVITEEDTHFGSVDKKDYDYCLKQVTDKHNKTYINIILSHKIFENIPFHVFKKKYYNMFVRIRTNINENIFHENDFAENVYFLKNGEFELTMKKNFKEINELIKYLGGEPKSILIEPSSQAEKNSLDNFLNQKRTTKISIINSHELLGLDDIVYDGKYQLSATCLLKKGEVLKIQRTFLENIIDRENNLKKKVDEYLHERKKYLLERLLSIMESRISIFLNKNKKNSFIETIRSNKGNEKDKNNLVNQNISYSRNQSLIPDLNKNVSSISSQNAFLPFNLENNPNLISARNEYFNILSTGNTEFNNFFLTSHRSSLSNCQKPIHDMKNTSIKLIEKDKLTSQLSKLDSKKLVVNIPRLLKDNRYTLNHSSGIAKSRNEKQTNLDVPYKNERENKEINSLSKNSIKLNLSKYEFNERLNNFIKNNYINNIEFNHLSNREKTSGQIKGKKLKMKNILKNIDFKKNTFLNVNNSLKYSNSQMLARSNMNFNK